MVTSECSKLTSKYSMVTTECSMVTSECLIITSECSMVTSECLQLRTNIGFWLQILFTFLTQIQLMTKIRGLPQCESSSRRFSWGAKSQELELELGKDLWKNQKNLLLPMSGLLLLGWLWLADLQNQIGLRSNYLGEELEEKKPLFRSTFVKYLWRNT